MSIYQSKQNFRCWSTTRSQAILTDAASLRNQAVNDAAAAPGGGGGGGGGLGGVGAVAATQISPSISSSSRRCGPQQLLPPTLPLMSYLA